MSAKVDNEYLETYLMAPKCIPIIKSTMISAEYMFEINQWRKNPSYHFVKYYPETDAKEIKIEIGKIVKYSSGYYEFKLDAECPYSLRDNHIRAFRYIIDCINKHESPSLAEVWHNGHCAICGIRLTDPKSIRIGIGPICLLKCH